MNPSSPWKTWAFTLLRLACGFLFIYASQDKLGNADKFLGVVQEYHVLPAPWAPLAAVVIPWLEFFTGLCLVLGWRWRAAALVFCALMAVYTVALSINLLNGVVMACGCFSMDSTEKVTWWTILRDLIFLAVGLLVLGGPQGRMGLDSLQGAQKRNESKPSRRR